ncbi:MAG: hypothetical protein JSV44_11860 [Candidatus Zixiibacteriota bacterium]|nr:MAG: hypothetical protein JSV44_11860 [candidate division Zixibacteria bacterium]
MDKIKRLEREIEELENSMKKNPFGGLFDRAARKRAENRLKKLRKELEELTKKKK